MQDVEAAIAYRGWVAESHHRARVVVTAPDGNIRLALGDMEPPTLPRSALKPFQVIAMLRNGLDLEGELLALAGASHWGEPFHLDGARAILAGVGLNESNLVNTPDIPLDEDARFDWIRSGHGKEPVAHNCSGKHSAMLRTCVRAGWPTDGYRDPSHPLQLAIRAVIDEYCGVIGEPVTDGCSAPAFSCTLDGLARGFGAWALAQGEEERRIHAAYHSHAPYMSGSADRTVLFVEQIDGLVMKVGAEGILAAALPDGTGVAVKMSDGMGRGRFDVMAAVLGSLGHTVEGLTPEVVIAPELSDALASL
ncbi:MAG: asparaginase [Propionibacteriaceae bacterium]|nr:asparaginase [Propionibacteriaceae bacterium]